MDRRKNPDRRQTTDLSDAWVSMPSLLRLLVSVAIIACCGWLALQIFALITLAKLALTAS